MLSFSALPPLALYIHLPWCVRKCPYCDFNSHAAPGQLPELEYVAALLADLEQELPRVWGRTVHSIFLGGGTPSLFSPAALDQLLSGVQARLKLQPGLEITLEANPGTFEQQRFRDFRQLGINRLSIGIQSFSDLQLKKLGRIHNGGEARQAIAMARHAGFDNLNLDLMFGLPQQTLAEAQADLLTALSFEPQHLSYYQLTLEPNTPFAHQPPVLPHEDTLWQIQCAGLDLLASRGFQHYEISAHARPGQQCRHNLNYWLFGDYLGIGAGAHGKITDAAAQHITRRSKQRHPQRYLETAATPDVVSEQRIVSRQEVGLEFLMNTLRLHDGFPVALFRERCGTPLTLISAGLQQAEQRGLIEQDLQWIRPTELGRRYLNDLLSLFVPDNA
ncbi:MAG: oxygen-independent coproporphyrinogen III oxidase-like protein [Gammaproteobacteria bacterium]|nr:oxygen-independent coproporphyrinogen III oxidase-like protein [Gammaproteobacteria bacterium]